MMHPLLAIVPFIAQVSAAAASVQPLGGRTFPALPIGWWQHRAASLRSTPHPNPQLTLQDGVQQRPVMIEPHEENERYPTQYFTQKTTHFPEVAPVPSDNQTFKQRYWFDASYYKEGGPVIVLDGGETSGADRIPYLEKGILKILAEETGGIGIVLEHRFYGTSFPFSDLSIASLKYLDTAQSLADSAYFAQNVELPGLEHFNLTAPHTPWIYYGGSYAGAKAAFMRVVYPDVIWGAIASSAVTHAEVNFWEYYTPILLHSNPTCMSALTQITTAIDHVLALQNPTMTASLKWAFGLTNVTDDRDFVNVLASPLGSWQATNWDPKVSTSEFDEFCGAITNSSSEMVEYLPKGLTKTLGLPIAFPLKAFAGYAGYVRRTVAKECETTNQDECFATDGARYKDEGLEQIWRAWIWQVCTEWGYFQGGAPDGEPSIVSRLLDLEYNSRICKLAFGDAVPSTPNTTKVNQYGDYALSSPRLAFIDGSFDPWLYATPHSPHAPERKSTANKPFWIIPGGVHHWDENGLEEGEGEVPLEIEEVHAWEKRWLKGWVEEFWKKEEGI